MDGSEKEALLNKAKQYSSIKYAFAILGTVYLVILLLVFLGTGASKTLTLAILNFKINQYLVAPLYIFIAYISYYLLSLPLNFYRSYILEHKFSLSNQSIRNWFIDEIKSGPISYCIGLILVSVFYYILSKSQNYWWLIISLFWIFFSLILARLMPIIIIPLFFKYKRLSDDNLRQRVMNLANKMRIKILDCFEIDFSKKTLKANAAFVGWGKTRRVILADTLRDRYSYDEIEVILAHEFAHYKLKHLLKLIFMNSVATIICFYLIFRTSNYSLKFFGLTALSDIAALPVILLYFVLLGIILRPLENYIIRRLEKNADLEALKITGSKDAFISMMEKLATQNLSDRNPNLLIKFCFFDHPPIDERIAMAKSIQKGIR